MRMARDVLLAIAGVAIAAAGVVATGPGAFYVVAGTLLVVVGVDLLGADVARWRIRREHRRRRRGRAGYLRK